MRVMSCLPHLTGLLLLAAAPLAGAQDPLPDPIAPAVIGRPLDQIRPARPVRAKPAAVKPKRSAQAVTSKTAVASAPPGPLAVAPAPAQQGAAPQRAAKHAVDDRVDPRTQVMAPVGQGMRLASKPLGPGAYFGSKAQALVRKYYQANPGPERPANWKIGEPVPPRAALSGVPDELRASLPRLPPGHQYVQLDGEVVLVAMQSRMVVDGISRSVP